MSPNPPPSNGAPDDSMELPQAVIAQAEAAATENQREEEGPTPQAAPGASIAKEGNASSSASRRVCVLPSLITTLVGTFYLVVQANSQ